MANKKIQIIINNHFHPNFSEKGTGVVTSITTLNDEHKNLATLVQKGITDHLNKVKNERYEEYGKIVGEMKQNEVVDLIGLNFGQERIISLPNLEQFQSTQDGADQ
jgi:hypothetical protein